MNFIIVFIVIHGNTIHNAVVDGQTVDKALREIMLLGAFFYHYKDVWV